MRGKTHVCEPGVHQRTSAFLKFLPSNCNANDSSSLKHSVGLPRNFFYEGKEKIKLNF